MQVPFFKSQALWLHAGFLAIATVGFVTEASAQGRGGWRSCQPCQSAPHYGQPMEPGLPQPGELTPAESMLNDPNDPEAGPPTGDLMNNTTIDPSAALNQPGLDDFAMGGGIGGGVAGNSDVGGYINQATLNNRVRLRYDNAQGGNTDAAEFLYGAYLVNNRPAIQNYDYQDTSVYLERLLTPSVSLFVEAAYRFAEYDDFLIGGGGGGGAGVRRRESGFSDMNAGVRYALVDECNEHLTAQLKVFVPTGDVFQGLGTGHVSLEPGLMHQVDYQRLHLFSEVHDWISLGDTRVPANFPENAGRFYGGNVLRYGLGAGYDIGQACDRKITLLGEVVGWTVLYGMKNRDFGLAGNVTDASGDTAVNAKIGLRYTQRWHSLYVGYGVPMTDFRWYNSLIRAEYTFAGW